MCELCRINAPLNKIYHYKAKSSKDINPLTGATQNHVDVMDDMINNNYNTCLIIEDDITFTSDINKAKGDLIKFFEREYEYDICFLAASKFHKREPMDDLLIKSKQICTTSSAYLVNKKSIKKVRNCAKEGLDYLLKRGDPNVYTIDRYWCKLQKDNKMFIFKNKISYQRPSYSNTKKTVAAFLD